MQVQVTGKQLDVGDALRARITDDLTGSIGKYFERGGDADVVVSQEGHSFIVDCRVMLASGEQLSSHGQGGDAHAAFDAALTKVEKRIRRYKRRLKDHNGSGSTRAESVRYAVLSAPVDEGDAWDEGDDEASGPPSGVVIAEQQKSLKTMTVAMAVMELDLTDGQAIVFRNAAHGGFSVVYRRPDGNIGWIDPERPSSNGGGKAV